MKGEKRKKDSQKVLHNFLQADEKISNKEGREGDFDAISSRVSNRNSVARNCAKVRATSLELRAISSDLPV